MQDSRSEASISRAMAILCAGRSFAEAADACALSVEQVMTAWEDQRVPGTSYDMLPNPRDGRRRT